MSDNGLRALLLLLAGALLLACVLLARPDLLASPLSLGAIVAGELVLAAVCKYRKAFFPVLIGAFVWAGSDLPLHAAWLQGRWFVLTIGAVAGLAVYMKDREHHFSTFHLVAFFCVLSALVSASVSAYPEEAVLKALSLALLFIYGVGGARTAVQTIRPEVFFQRLRLGCEIITWLTAACYWLLRWEVLGNPNSLGAVMGVVVIPLLLWGFVTSERVTERSRMGVELVLALLLLISSYARAGMVGAAVACLLVCVALRQYRLVIKGIAVAVVLAIGVAVLVPLPDKSRPWESSASITSVFLYKGKQEQGLMGSREGPWNKTWSVIQDHPWFGSGFGTSVTEDDLTQLALAHSHFDSRIVREHGNSYLAITEWVGLLGVVPFYFLIGMMALNVRRVFSRLRQTGDALSPAAPAAAIVAAGLVHAAFEDWMFAVGYYLCVFFWAIAFILVDVLQEPAGAASAEPIVIPLAGRQPLAAASGQ
jgi:O-antigen ligase